MSTVSIESRIGTIVLRLRLEHTEQRMRVKKRAFESIERHVLASYGATRLASGEHQLKLSYRTDQDLDDLIDDLLFEDFGRSTNEGLLLGNGGTLGGHRSPMVERGHYPGRKSCTEVAGPGRQHAMTSSGVNFSTGRGMRQPRRGEARRSKPSIVAVLRSVVAGLGSGPHPGHIGCVSRQTGMPDSGEGGRKKT